MTDIVQRLRDEGKDAFARKYSLGMYLLCAEAADEIEKLREFAGWIDTWISNPARAYSHDALEGLFGMTQDKISVLKNELSR